MSAKAIHGRFGEVYVEDDMIAEISAFTINETADTAEATAMGDIAASVVTVRLQRIGMPSATDTRIRWSLVIAPRYCFTPPAVLVAI